MPEGQTKGVEMIGQCGAVIRAMRKVCTHLSRGMSIGGGQVRRTAEVVADIGSLKEAAMTLLQPLPESFRQVADALSPKSKVTAVACTELFTALAELAALVRIVQPERAA